MSRPNSLRLAALTACLSLFDLANRSRATTPLNPSEIPLSKFYPSSAEAPDSAWILQDVLSTMLALKRQPASFLKSPPIDPLFDRPRQALAFFLPRSATSVLLTVIPCIVHGDGIHYQLSVDTSRLDLIHIYMPRPDPEKPYFTDTPFTDTASKDVEGSPLPTSSVPDADPTPHGYDPDDEFDDDEDLDDSEDDDEDLDEDDIDRALDEPLTSDDDDDDEDWSEAEYESGSTPVDMGSSEIELKDASVRPDPYDTF